MGVADATWHHVCVTWEQHSKELQVYEDGDRKYQSEGFSSSAKNLGIEGTVAARSYYLYKLCSRPLTG